MSIQSKSLLHLSVPIHLQIHLQSRNWNQVLHITHSHVMFNLYMLSNFFKIKGAERKINPEFFRSISPQVTWIFKIGGYTLQVQFNAFSKTTASDDQDSACTTYKRDSLSFQVAHSCHAAITITQFIHTRYEIFSPGSSTS